MTRQRPKASKRAGRALATRPKLPEHNTVVAFDLSLRSAAAIAVPLDFSDGLRWESVRWATFGRELTQDAGEAARCGRMRDLATWAVAFAREHAAAVVFLEEQAFSKNGAMARELAGATWTVRLALHDATVSVRLVTASAARKVFLGHARAGAKAAVQEALRGIGAPFAESGDVCDAFAVANYGASDLGARCVMLGLEGAA